MVEVDDPPKLAGRYTKIFHGISHEDYFVTDEVVEFVKGIMYQ